MEVEDDSGGGAEAAQEPEGDTMEVKDDSGGGTEAEQGAEPEQPSVPAPEPPSDPEPEPEPVARTSSKDQ